MAYSKDFIALLKKCDGKTIAEIRALTGYKRPDKALRDLCRRYEVKYKTPIEGRSPKIDHFIELAPTHTYKQVCEILDIDMRTAYYYAEYYGAFCIDERSLKTHDRDWAPNTISAANLQILRNYEGNTLKLIKFATDYPHNVDRLRVLLNRYKIWYRFENSKPELVSEDTLETVRKVGCELTLEHISAMCGITVMQARNMCARNNIKYRRKSSGKDIEICNTFKALKSVAKTAEFLDVSEAMVRRVVNQFNL